MRIVYLQSAQDDLADIHEYLAEYDPGKAAEFIDLLRDTVASLDTFPLRFGEWESGKSVHKLNVGRYGVFYRASENMVTIGRVLHLRRDFDAIDLDDIWDD